LRILHRIDGRGHALCCIGKTFGCRRATVECLLASGDSAGTRLCAANRKPRLDDPPILEAVDCQRNG